MAEIFLSYASEDRERARPLAAALESLGWSVWWDRKIPAGKTFAEVIEAAVTASQCVIVLWSHESVKSQWVREEADEGKKRGKLVPVLVDPVEPPMGFRSIQAADLVGWDGTMTPGFQQLVADLTSLLGAPLKGGAVSPDSQPPTGRPAGARPIAGRARPSSRMLWIALGIAIAIAAVAGWGVHTYYSDAQRRAAELEAQKKALEDEHRQAEEERVRKESELAARQKDFEEQQRMAAEAARKAEAERQRQAEAATRTAAAEAEQKRLAAEAARPVPSAPQGVSPLPPLYVANTVAQVGRIYRVESNRVTECYARPQRGRISSVAAAPDGTIYFADANNRYLYRLEGSREVPIYTHTTYVRYIAFDGTGRLHFSEATGAGGDGVIYRLEGSRAVPFYKVRLADVDGFWAGKFAFDRDGFLWLGSGNRVPSYLYKIMESRPQRMFTRRGSIDGFTFTESDILFVESGAKGIQRLTLPHLQTAPALSLGTIESLSDVKAVREATRRVPRTRSRGDLRQGRRDSP